MAQLKLRPEEPEDEFGRPATERSHAGKGRRLGQVESYDLPLKYSAAKIRLTDLCVEDKAKVGELARRLAEEKSERLALAAKRDKEKSQYESELKRLRLENERLQGESERLKRELESAMKAFQMSPREKLGRIGEESSISLSDTPQNSITFRSPEYTASPSNHAIETPKASAAPQKCVSTSPIKEPAPLAVTQSIGTQTTTDKSMQSETPPLVTPRALSHTRSKPSAEIKTLKQDIASLSMSLRNFGESVPSSVRGGKHFRFDHPMMSASPVIKSGNSPSSLASPMKELVRPVEEPLERSLQPHFDIFSPRDLKPSKLTLNIPRSPIPERSQNAGLDESLIVDYNEDLFSIIEEMETDSKAGPAGNSLSAGDLNSSRMVEMIEEMERQTQRK